jgi:hypothetical protein
MTYTYLLITMVEVVDLQFKWLIIWRNGDILAIVDISKTLPGNASLL